MHLLSEPNPNFVVPRYNGLTFESIFYITREMISNRLGKLTVNMSNKF